MKVIAGPHFGEFGWEIIHWQAYLRRLSRFHNPIFVACRFGHEVLYKDFAAEFFTYQDDTQGDCWHTRGKPTEEHRKITEDFYKSISNKKGCLLIKPSCAYRLEDQHFIPFQAYGPTYDVVIHARSAYGSHPNRAWSLQNWRDLVSKLKEKNFKIAEIGHLSYSDTVEGVDESYRGKPLEEYVSVFSNARLFIGPSSGPACLSQLCKLPVLVWGTKEHWPASGNLTIRQKFTTKNVWNPLDTPATVIDDYGFNPPVEVVLQAALECLK